jgi:hypothetical protein
MNCKNCEVSLDGKFCANCGQKADISRLTFVHVLHEFFHAFTHADKGFLLLSKRLITQPGLVAREYIEGKRKRYFNPLSFIVITSAVNAYISVKTGYFAALSSTEGPDREVREVPQIMREVFEISNNNGKLLSLIVAVPLLAFFSWLFFRRSKYVFPETFVLNSFIVGESHMIRMLIFIPFFLLFPQYVQLNLMIFESLLLIYLTIAYKQFFKQNTFLTIVKTILTMALFIIFYWVCILVYVYAKHLLMT